MNEKWKPIPGYIGYKASNLGRVKSLDRVLLFSNGQKHKRKGRILKPATNGKYLFVALGKGNLMFVHRLVGLAFLKNPKNLPEINHKDFNKENNNLSNLEWSTKLDNMLHCKIAGRMKGFASIGEINPRNKLSESDILTIRKRAATEKARDLANEYGVTFSHIRNIFYKRIWKHLK